MTDHITDRTTLLRLCDKSWENVCKAKKDMDKSWSRIVLPGTSSQYHEEIIEVRTATEKLYQAMKDFDIITSEYNLVCAEEEEKV